MYIAPYIIKAYFRTYNLCRIWSLDFIEDVIKQ